MAEITTEKKTQITITNNIKIDGVIVVGQQANINSENPEDTTISEWTSDKELYKANRQIIREAKAIFEDEVFEKQDELILNKNGE